MENKFLIVAVFLAIGLKSVRATTVVGCDPGWEIGNGNCYLFQNNKMITWQQARDECNRLDSSLVRITSQTELTWFSQFVPQNYPSAGYWTGLNDNSATGSSPLGTGIWKWGDFNYANMSLVKFAQAPVNDGQSNCAGTTLAGTISDRSCKSKQGYICQLRITTPGCPESWLITDSACYYVSDTSDISQLVTWQVAATKCKQLNQNSNLMTLTNNNDTLFLSGQLQYLSKNTSIHWLGLQKKNGNWAWSTGEAYNKNLFSWATEPDNIAGIENCGVVRMNGQYSDRDCKSQNNYVCKKPQDVFSDASNNGCGPWIRAGHMCYEFYTGPKSTWYDARQQCLSDNGDLLNVKSMDENVWLTQQMLDPSNNRVYWTGLNDQAVEGTFKWADGSPLNNTFITWNQEPNDYYGNEDCAVIYNEGGYNDVNCASTKAAAICEYDGVANCPSAAWMSRPADQGTGLNCYLFTAYNNVSVLFTYSEALRYCQGLATSGTNLPILLSVDTASEKTWVNQKLNAYTTDNVYGWWTSLNDRQSEGYWTFGGNMLLDPTLVNWRGEPDSRTPDEDCVMINYAAAYHDVKCNSKLGFVCQRAAYRSWASGAESVRSPAWSVLVLAATVYGLLVR